MRIVVFLFCSLIAGICQAQKLPDIGMTVRINEGDRTIVAEVRPVNSTVTTKADHYYFWYGAGKIQQTRGGYSGKLLNGVYTAYYPNKNLQTQGRYKEGSKTGAWKSWTETGELSAIVNYQDGLRSGGFSEYDEDGKLFRRGDHKADLLHGKIYTYKGDSVAVTTYKNGKAIPPKEGKPIWKKMIPFRKKPVKVPDATQARP